MQPIYTPADIQHVIEATIGSLDHIEELDDGRRDVWMERRRAFVDVVGEQVARELVAFNGGKSNRILVFAGDGICGAYAMAAARHLHKDGIPARVILFNIGNVAGPDAIAARDAFVRAVGDQYLQEVINPGAGFSMPKMDRRTLVLDGIFGSEYDRPLRGGYQHVARYINEHSPRVVAVDVPSGMSTELGVGMINRNIVHASLTLTLVGPTLSFFMPENAELIGKWKTLQVPFDQVALDSVSCKARLIDAKAVRAVLPVRQPYASKADLGHALIFAGSYGMLGAAVLATRAACRSGCGKVTAHGPRCAFYVMQSAVPSAMFTTDGADVDIQEFEMKSGATAVAIGPGIGTSDLTTTALEIALKASYAVGRPLILDADALNCMSQKASMIDFIPPRSIITPHAGEFDRLFGTHTSHASRVVKAIQMAQSHKIVIVLKGHYTLTIWPDGSVIVNSSGTEALATAGAGDVLTGLMAGLVAQKMMPEIAAVAAVYIHGVAGRMAADLNGVAGTTAEDIADCIGRAIATVANPKK